MVPYNVTKRPFNNNTDEQGERLQMNLHPNPCRGHFERKKPGYRIKSPYPLRSDSVSPLFMQLFSPLNAHEQSTFY